MNSLSYLVCFGKISKRSAIVPRSYAQREPCVINEIENQSGPDLDIGKLTMILTFFLISRKFLIDWYMICIGLLPNFFFLQQGRGKTQNRPLWKIRHAQKFEPNFFFHLHMTPEQDQKSNRVRKALHTQLHSDLTVLVNLLVSRIKS